MRDGEITLNASSRPIGNNGEHKIKIYSRGDDPQEIMIHIIEVYGYEEREIIFSLNDSKDLPSQNMTTPKIQSFSEPIQGQNLEIDFNIHNQYWIDAVNAVKINGFRQKKYAFEKGRLIIDGSAIRKGSFNLVIEAEGYDKVELQLEVLEKVSDDENPIDDEILEEEIKEEGGDSSDSTEVVDSLEPTEEDHLDKEEEQDDQSDQNNLPNILINKKEYGGLTIEASGDNASDWIRSIREIEVNGRIIKKYSEYNSEPSNGKLHILEAAFKDNANYHIIIKAEGYEDIRLTAEQEDTLKEVPSSIPSSLSITQGQELKIRIGDSFLKEVSSYIQALKKGTVEIDGATVDFDEGQENFSFTKWIIISEDQFNDVGTFKVTLKAQGYEEKGIELEVK